MSIKLTDKQLEEMRKLEEDIDKIRLRQYEKAVETVEQQHEQSSTLSKAISKGELKNLVVARPQKPQRPEFENDADVFKYMRKLRNDVQYGVEKAQQRFLENYADSVAKAWGEDLAQEVLNLASTNPDKFIALVNSKQLPSIKFIYNTKDSATIDEYMDILHEEMSEE